METCDTCGNYIRLCRYCDKPIHDGERTATIEIRRLNTNSEVNHQIRGYTDREIYKVCFRCDPLLFDLLKNAAVTPVTPEADAAALTEKRARPRREFGFLYKEDGNV